MPTCIAMMNHDIVDGAKPLPPEAAGRDRKPGNQRLKPHQPKSVKAFMTVSEIVSRARPPLKIPRMDPRWGGAFRQICGSSTRARTHKVRKAGRIPTKNTTRHPHRGRTIIVTSAADA